MAGVVVAVPVPACVVIPDEGVGVEDGGIWPLDCPEVVPAVPVPVPTDPGFAPANAGATVTKTIAATASVRTMVIGSPFGIVDAGLDYVSQRGCQAGDDERLLFT